MRRLAIGLLAGLAVVGAAVLPAGAATTNVTIADNAFQPKDVTVDQGDTVVWTDQGDNPHSVTADDGSFDSSPTCSFGGGCLAKGQTFSFTFDKTGTFAYHCKIHGGSGGVGMSGVITVKAAAGAGKPVTRLAGADRVATA